MTKRHYSAEAYHQCRKDLPSFLIVSPLVLVLALVLAPLGLAFYGVGFALDSLLCRIEP